MIQNKLKDMLAFNPEEALKQFEDNLKKNYPHLTQEEIDKWKDDFDRINYGSKKFNEEHDLLEQISNLNGEFL